MSTWPGGSAARESAWKAPLYTFLRSRECPCGMTARSLTQEALGFFRAPDEERPLAAAHFARTLRMDKSQARKGLRQAIDSGLLVDARRMRGAYRMFRLGPRLLNALEAWRDRQSLPHDLGRDPASLSLGGTESPSGLGGLGVPPIRGSLGIPNPRERAGEGGSAPLSERPSSALDPAAHFRTWTGRDPSEAAGKRLAELAREYPDSRTWQRATESAPGDARSPISVLGHRLAEARTVLDAEAAAQAKRDAASKSQENARIDYAMRALSESGDRVRGERLTWIEAERLHLNDIIEHDNGKRAAMLVPLGDRMQVVDERGDIVNVPSAAIATWHKTHRAGERDAIGKRLDAPFAGDSSREPRPISDCLLGLAPPAPGDLKAPRKRRPAPR